MSAVDTNEPERQENRYWNGSDAVLGLAAATRTLERIEADRGRYTLSLPFHVEQERDEAVEQARDAIRFLMQEES